MGMFTEIIYEVDLRERKTGNSVETIYSGTYSAEAYEIADKWNKEHGLGEIQEDYESYEELCDYVSDGLFADVYQVELYVEKGKELDAMCDYPVLEIWENGKTISIVTGSDVLKKVTDETKGD